MAGELRITTPGANATDLDVAWRDRLADAEALLDAGRNAGAIATATYALEIRLKVLVCKKLDVLQLPRAFEMHDLNALLLLAGLSRRLERKTAGEVRANWEEIISQSGKLNDLRYLPDAKWTATQAAQFFRQLKSAPNGVLPWLSRQR